MHKTFTSDDLLRYAGDQMSPDEAEEFRNEIMNSTEFADEVLLYFEEAELVPGQQQPSVGVVQRLLSYSSALRIGKTSSLGLPYEVVLN